MEEEHRDKTLEIRFEINSESYTLKYLSSNYELSMNEIARASLRPSHLVLDDKFTYVKSTEVAEPKDGKNILRVNYCRSNHKS